MAPGERTKGIRNAAKENDPGLDRYDVVFLAWICGLIFCFQFLPQLELFFYLIPCVMVVVYVGLKDLYKSRYQS